MLKGLKDAFCVSYRWVFIYEKGYQSTDTAVSSVFTKMKGVGYTNVSGNERVWDVSDYVFPPQVGFMLCQCLRWLSEAVSLRDSRFKKLY